MTTRRRLTGAATAVIFAATLQLSLTGCSGKAKADQEDQKSAAKPVRVVNIKRTDIADVLSYVADLEPEMDVALYSTIPDRILSFPWQDGDEIKKGQRVALVRAAGLTKGLQQLTAQMDGMDAQLRNQQAELKRSQDLLQRGVLTQSQYDQISTGVVAGEAQRRALDASYGQLAVTAGNAIIKTPIDGVIADKRLETGDLASPQIPLCRVLSIDRLKASLHMVESEVPKVKLGQQVELRVDAYPDRVFEGEVIRIQPFLDPNTRTNAVEVAIKNPKDENTGVRPLKPGMYGRAELIVGMNKNALVAPEPALLLDNILLEQQKPGEILRKAFVVKDGKAEKRIIKLGARKSSMYEVIEGLEDGDQLIVRGQHGLRDGQAVEVVNVDEDLKSKER